MFSIFARITIAIVISVSLAIAFDPPKSLKWGQTPDEVRDVFSFDPDKPTVEKGNQDKPRKGYREYPELWLPEGYTRYEVKGIKINGKKAERSELFMDGRGTLQSFHYIFMFDNNDSGNKEGKGFRKAWVFHSDIKAILIDKYGEPVSDDATANERDRSIESGSRYDVVWKDSTGSKVTLVITRQTHDMVIAKLDAFLVFVLYDSPDYQPALNHRDEKDSGDL